MIYQQDMINLVPEDVNLLNAILMIKIKYLILFKKKNLMFFYILQALLELKSQFKIQLNILKIILKMQ